MAGVLHGSARTTLRIRVELQASKESSRSLAAQYGLNPKTVANWRKLTQLEGACVGLRDGLQLRQAPQRTALEDTVPNHLSGLDQKTQTDSRSIRTTPFRDHKVSGFQNVVEHLAYTIRSDRSDERPRHKSREQKSPTAEILPQCSA